MGSWQAIYGCFGERQVSEETDPEGHCEENDLEERWPEEGRRSGQVSQRASDSRSDQAVEEQGEQGQGLHPKLEAEVRERVGNFAAVLQLERQVPCCPRRGRPVLSKAGLII